MAILSDHDSEPTLKRRKIRKGTQSCWECKRRKVRCSGEQICQNCQRRGTPCIGQDLPDEPQSAEISVLTPESIGITAVCAILIATPRYYHLSL